MPIMSFIVFFVLILILSMAMEEQPFDEGIIRTGEGRWYCAQLPYVMVPSRDAALRLACIVANVSRELGVFESREFVDACLTCLRGETGVIASLPLGLAEFDGVL